MLLFTVFFLSFFPLSPPNQKKILLFFDTKFLSVPYYNIFYHFSNGLFCIRIFRKIFRSFPNKNDYLLFSVLIGTNLGGRNPCGMPAI